MQTTLVILLVVAVVFNVVLLWDRSRRVRQQALAGKRLAQWQQSQAIELRQLRLANQRAIAGLSREHASQLAAAKQQERQSVRTARETLERKHRLELMKTARKLADRQVERHKASELERVTNVALQLEAQGHAFVAAQQWEQAAVEFDQLVALAQYSGNRQFEAVGLYRSAAMYKQLGELVRAEILFKQAYLIAQEILPSADPRLRQYRSGWEKVERQITVHKINSLCQEASRACASNNPEYAQCLYHDATAIAEWHGMPMWQAAVLNYAHEAYMLTGDSSGAIAALESALAIVNQHAEPDHPLRTSIESNLSHVKEMHKARKFQKLISLTHNDFQLGQLEDAEHDARAALEEAKKTFCPRDWRTALAMDHLAIALCKNGDRTTAKLLLEQALHIAEDFRSNRPHLAMAIEQHQHVCEAHE